MEYKSGIMVSEISFSSLPLILKNAILDFFIIDYEHGPFDYTDMSKLIMNARLAGIKCIVRLPNNERKDIIKLLDMGADGLLLPMTSFAKDIEKVVNYAKYPPLGKRGISTMRAHTLYNPPETTKYIKQANEDTMIFAQIETIDGVNNIDEILGVNGVTGVFVGPNDLSADYGCLGDNNAKEILNSIEKVAASAKNHNKLSGIITGNSNYLKLARKCKMELYSIGSELNLLQNGAKEIVKKVNEL